MNLTNLTYTPCGLPIGEQQIDGHRPAEVVVNHSRATPLAPAERREAQFSDTAGAGNQVSRCRIFCEDYEYGDLAHDLAIDTELAGRLVEGTREIDIADDRIASPG